MTTWTSVWREWAKEWPMIHLLTWRGSELWPVLRPATRGRSCHVVHLLYMSITTPKKFPLSLAATVFALGGWKSAVEGQMCPWRCAFAVMPIGLAVVDTCGRHRWAQRSSFIIALSPSVDPSARWSTTVCPPGSNLGFLSTRLKFAAEVKRLGGLCASECMNTWMPARYIFRPSWSGDHAGEGVSVISLKYYYRFFLHIIFIDTLPTILMRLKPVRCYRAACAASWLNHHGGAVGWWFLRPLIICGLFFDGGGVCVSAITALTGKGATPRAFPNQRLLLTIVLCYAVECLDCLSPQQLPHWMYG